MDIRVVTRRYRLIKMFSARAFLCLSVAASCFAPLVTPCSAESTINATNKYAYSANAGWLNGQANMTNGAVMGQYFCTGYVYSANVGWIHLGDGPTNLSNYINDSAADYGVNVITGKLLRGFAYGANIGWINFEGTGDPQIDLVSGVLSGFAYGANVGWISLSNALAHVQTDTLDSGSDTDSDSVPDVWEYKYATNLTMILGGTNDTDGDGVSDQDEYGADTDPLSDAEMLTFTGTAAGNTPGIILTWVATKPTRLYSIETTDGLSNGTVWVDSGLGQFSPDPSNSTTRGFSTTGITRKFFRAVSHVPLAP